MSRTPQPQNPSLFPPIWSIIMTLLVVLLCTGLTVFMVLGLGGQTIPPEPERVVMITPAIINTPLPNQTVPGAATLLPQSTPQNQVAFVMTGPTLPPPKVTPTSISIDMGKTVRVIDVGNEQLNVREKAGIIDTDVVFRAPENTLFTIVGGPSQADGLTWWQIQDVENARRIGWAASNYLEVVPEVTP